MIRKGDIGTIIEIEVRDQSNVVVNLSPTTTRQFIFEKPNQTFVTKSAVFSGTGTDGKIRYTVESGLLDQAGLWGVQAFIAMPAGSWKTEIRQFMVGPNLE